MSGVVGKYPPSATGGFPLPRRGLPLEDPQAVPGGQPNDPMHFPRGDKNVRTPKSPIFATVLGALTLTALIAAAPASAEAGEPRSVTVHASEFDLASEPGKTALKQGLARAAKEVCRGLQDPRKLNAMRAYRECRNATTSTSIPQAEAAIAKAGTATNLAAAE